MIGKHCAATLWALSVWYSAASYAADAPQLYLVDAHSQADSRAVMERVVGLMDRAGVRHTILSGRRGLTNGDIASFAAQQPDRITAAVRTKGRAYAENRAGYYKSLERDANSGRFGAIAELLMFHAQKGRKADEVAVFPEDERVQAALKIAKERNWPLVVHIEFAALSDDDKIEYTKQFEAMLAQNPQHPFVLIHMGQLHHAQVRNLIESHPNVYFMTSHTTPTAVNKSKQPWTPMFQGDGLAPEWRELVIEKPDRFILAFDNVWPEHWGDHYLRQAEQWRAALSGLPTEAAHAVAHGNAERLWRIPKR